MSTMTKAAFIAAVAAEAGLSKGDVSSVYNAIESVTRKALKEGQAVPVAGVGKVAPVDKPARTARNPATGEAVEIPAKTVPKVTVGKALKDHVAE